MTLPGKPSRSQMTYEDLAMVIPVWFSPKVPRETIRERLLRTLEGVGAYVPPERVLLSFDGDDRSLEVLREIGPSLQERNGGPFHILSRPENGGKGRAVAFGLQTLLREVDFRYCVLRDCDGDHHLSDVSHLYQYAQWMRQSGAGGEVLVVGRRSSLHHSLGWWRGEFEELLNRLTVEALRFHLATQGRGLRTRYLSAYPEPPDLMSGYKLCSRGICRIMAERDWQPPLEASAVDMYRFGMETFPVIEGVLGGADLGEVQRLVGDDRSVSGHGRFEEPGVNAGLARWVLLRLGIPGEVAGTLLENAISRSRLLTTEEGRASLREFSAKALQGLPGQTSAGPPALGLF